MFNVLLAAEGGKIDPLGHVLDRNIIGGETPLFSATEGWTVFGSAIVTMHMLTLVIAFGILIWVMSIAAKAIGTGPESQGNDRYLTKGRMSQMIEVITLYLRDKVVYPVLGDNTNKFLPYLMTLFFFILMNNLLGLIPLLDMQHIVGGFANGDTHWAIIGGTATGNLAVTGGLALIAFLVITWHGIKENGIGGWLHHLLGGAPAYLAPIMVPVELLSMFIKPAALAIRLFANMLAGHTLMATLALFGLMALNGTESWIAAGGISLISGLFAVAISFLELFVAFLQAFIFMFLTAVFLGQMNHHGHADEHGEDRHEPQQYDAEIATA